MYVGAYGLNNGKALFERASELMGFLPWWENKVKNEITMNGLEKSKERWRVLCEMFMDEDW